MKFDELLIHASAFSKLTTEPKSAADKAAGKLSVTTKDFLKELYIEETYGRKKEITSKQMQKGTEQEEEAITLYCRVHKKMYEKNTIRFTNEFLTGEPDLLHYENGIITQGVDIKCAWTIFSMPFPDDKIEKAYEWQNQCYMNLTGAEMWKTAHCLVNAPANLILDEKKKVWYKMRSPEQDEANYPLYIKQCVEIEKMMIYNMQEFKKANPGFDLDCKDWNFDIPLAERVFEFETRRDRFMQDDIPEFTRKARNYLNNIANGKFE